MIKHRIIVIKKLWIKVKQASMPIKRVLIKHTLHNLFSHVYTKSKPKQKIILLVYLWKFIIKSESGPFLT